MKKIICVLLTLAMMLSTSALAMNMERFLNEPDNAEMAGSIFYGLNDIINRAGTGKLGGLMVMIYSSIGIANANYPFMMVGFGADQFVATSGQIETDNAKYIIMSMGNLGMFAPAIEGVCSIVTTSDMVEVYRSIVESENVQITLMNQGSKYNFELTDEQKHQLSLIVAEFDEEIAKYLDPASPDYCAELATLYKMVGPSIAASKK